jgi:hypothetical protein
MNRDKVRAEAWKALLKKIVARVAQFPDESG